MFQLRLTTKREILLWMSTVDDLKKRVQEAELQVAIERRRADAAINLVLAKTEKMILDVPIDPKLQDPLEKIQEQMMDLFGEGDEAKAEKEISDKQILERLQS